MVKKKSVAFLSAAKLTTNRGYAASNDLGSAEV